MTRPTPPNQGLPFRLGTTSYIIPDEIIPNVGFRSEDLAEYVGTYRHGTRVTHLHGIRDGHDHRDIGGLADATLSMLLSWLTADSSRERVVTLEVFDRTDFEASVAILGRMLS